MKNTKVGMPSIDAGLMLAAVTAARFLATACKNENEHLNEPPAPPRFGQATTSVYTGSSISIRVDVEDPDNDEVRVRCAWNEGDTSEWSAWFRYSQFVSRDCPLPDTYAVYVQAQDRHGLISAWVGPCSALSRDSGNLPPHTPIPSGPGTVSLGANGRFYVAVTVSEPEGERCSYMVDWGNGDVLSWSSYFENHTSLQISRSALPIGAYEVRVRARDTNLNESFWSPACRIEVVP